MQDTDLTGRRGVILTAERVLEAGHFFREQHESDQGIDAQIEVKEGLSATGRLIAVQIKSGASYFSKKVETGF